MLNEEDVCSICLDEILPTDKIQKLDCEHVFHYGCCQGWINASRNGYDYNCPYCRHQCELPKPKPRVKPKPKKNQDVSIYLYVPFNSGMFLWVA